MCSNTLREYLKEYAEGGIEQLKKVKFYQPQSDLKEFSGTIEQYFSENPPRSIGEAAAKIRELSAKKRKYGSFCNLKHLYLFYVVNIYRYRLRMVDV